MKTRLPKTLLLAVLAAASVNSVAYAVHGDYTVDSADTVTVSTDTNYSALTEEQKAVFVQSIMTDSTDEAPKTMVKNGLGTLTIDQNIHLNNPLHVTEGTLAITNKTKVTSDVQAPSSFIASLSVGGKNAKVVVDDASFIQERGGVYPITIGTTDGSGALELTNNATVSTRHYIFAGYGHVLGDDGTVRNCGGYTAGTGYTGGDTGRSSILVDNSTLSAGSSFQFANVDITVTNGGVLKDNANESNAGNKDPGSWFGYALNSSTVVNVEEGGRLELNWLFESSQYEGSSTTININGEGSTLKIADVAYLSSVPETDTVTGTTEINITDGATADINKVIVGTLSEATVTVGAGSSAEVNAMTIGAEGEIVVGGTMNIENSLTLSDGAVITLEISDLKGTIPSLNLDGTMDGDAVFQLLFTTAALAQMEEGMELHIEDMLKGVGTNILTDGTTVTLVLADDVDADVADIFSATSYTTGYDSVITVKDTVAAVPEPTTATLSLLALAGLCARRRRR